MISLKADEIKVKSDTGNLKGSNYSTGQIVFESDTGNVTLTDGVGRLKGETDTGNIRVESEEIRNDIVLKSDTGNVTINVDKQPAISNDPHSERYRKTAKLNGMASRTAMIPKVSLTAMIGGGEIQIDIQSEVGNVKLGSQII